LNDDDSLADKLIDFFLDSKKELKNEKFHINSTRIQEYDENLVLLPITKGLTWPEYNALVMSKGYELPSREDVEQSGITVGDLDMWMPVRRSDFKEEDWCSIGVCGDPKYGQRYISRLDAMGSEKHAEHFPPQKMEVGHLPGPGANGFKY
jgi:hypothetical protein